MLEEAGASAALAASIFHYQRYSIRQTKEYLAGRGVPVRITDFSEARESLPETEMHSALTTLADASSRVFATEGVHLHGDGR